MSNKNKKTVELSQDLVDFEEVKDNSHSKDNDSQEDFHNHSNYLPLDSVKKLSLVEQYHYFNHFVEHHTSHESLDITTQEKNVLFKANEKLDKYYTKKSVAQFCYLEYQKIISQLFIPFQHLLFIEPSAGSGVFLDLIKEKKKGFDIAPSKESQHPIVKNDFLTGDLLSLLSSQEKSQLLAFIGNPPFGTKAKLAIDFVNKSLSYSPIVGFIVPLQFRKWSVQSKINKDALLILDKDLQENAFEFMGKDYKVRCCFQIWVLPEIFQSYLTFREDNNSHNLNENSNDLSSTLHKGIVNLRISQKPATQHSDFDMYQFNRTQEAMKYFDYDWDFAVPRQGFLDYTFKAYSKEECNPKQQWIFFKAKNKKVLQNLLALDFVKLSKKNIGIPGFGKADVIQEYNSLY